MKFFNGDVIKFICYNVHNNQNLIYYGVCLNNVDLQERTRIKYLNLYNDCISSQPVASLVAISLVGNVNSILSKIRLYLNNLSDSKKKEFLDECNFLVKERNKGIISGHETSSELNLISSVVGCSPLITACMVVNKNKILKQCLYDSSYYESNYRNKTVSEPSDKDDKIITISRSKESLKEHDELYEEGYSYFNSTLVNRYRIDPMLDDRSCS